LKKAKWGGGESRRQRGENVLNKEEGCDIGVPRECRTGLEIVENFSSWKEWNFVSFPPESFQEEGNCVSSDRHHDSPLERKKERTGK